MIGGYYVAMIIPTVKERDLPGLIAGPFATWAEADKLGPACIKFTAKTYPDLTMIEWGICEFWFHRLVLGAHNAEVWAKPAPVER